MQFYFLKTQRDTHTHTYVHTVYGTHSTTAAAAAAPTAAAPIRSQSWVDQRAGGGRCPIGCEMMPSRAGRLIRQLDGIVDCDGVRMR